MMLFGMTILFASCENKKDGGTVEIDNTDMVATGTYTGTAKEVDPEEQEIYVETNDGKILELYFKDDTRLTKNGSDVTFENLKKGNSVEVTLENEGNSLKPLEVKILD